MEFKGTKEKWKLVERERTEYSYQHTNEVQYGEYGECVAEYVHDKYDALLISKAPEMLEMLKLIIKEKELGIITGIDTLKIKKLIKEATEL